jgi:hypothetical protein
MKDDKDVHIGYGWEPYPEETASLGWEFVLLIACILFIFWLFSGPSNIQYSNVPRTHYLSDHIVKNGHHYVLEEQK